MKKNEEWVDLRGNKIFEVWEKDTMNSNSNDEASNFAYSPTGFALWSQSKQQN